mmetsp:Transcript_132399/g.264117  ORF Transcript_132399/g.264117 Transcript_132399/m.264117 type:complete len:338 (+) Transcript_132399:85-1098(+)
MQPVAIMSRPEVPPAPQVHSARGRSPARKLQASCCGSQSARHCSSPVHIERTRLPVLSGRGSPTSEEDRSHSPVRQAWDRSHFDSERYDRRKSTQSLALQGEAAQLALASASRRGSGASRQDHQRPCSVVSNDTEKLEDSVLQLYQKEDWATPRPKWQNSFTSNERAALMAEQGERRNRLKILISTGRLAAATREVACHAETHEARAKKSHGIDQKVRSNVRAMGEQRLELSSARKDLEVVLKKNHGPKSGVTSFIRHLLPQKPQTERSLSSISKDADSSVAAVTVIRSSPTGGVATQAQIRAEAAQQPPTYATGAPTRRGGGVAARRLTVEFHLDH